MTDIAKMLILTGCVLIGAGIVLFAAGRLPGDLLIQRKHLTVYIPLTTSVVLSVIVSLILWLWSRR